jgi:hypothetical protein
MVNSRINLKNGDYYIGIPDSSFNITKPQPTSDSSYVRYCENNITYNYGSKVVLDINDIESIIPMVITHYENPCNELTNIIDKTLSKAREKTPHCYLTPKDSEIKRRISESKFYNEYKDFSFMTPYGIVTFIHEYVESSIHPSYNLRVIYDGEVSDFNKIIDSIKTYYGEDHASVVKGYRVKTISDDHYHQLYRKPVIPRKEFVVI